MDSGRVLKLNAGSCYLPKDNIERPEGEDAHFICSEKNTIGVADGVGSWSAKGVDAGKYSRCLMTHAQMCAEELPGLVPPLVVLQRACRYTKLKKIRGSSTVCIISLNGELLDYANIGDSGLMVFRDDELVYQSPVQQHRFNYPYQVGSSSRDDDPQSAYIGEVAVKEGDIVVAGTDGLFDNMHPDEIWEILVRESDKDPDKIASTIAESALSNSLNLYYDSPFSIALEHAGLPHVLGGKYDDITVIVAKVELGTQVLRHMASESSFNVRSDVHVKVQDLLKLDRSRIMDDTKEVIESESSVILSAAEVPMCVRGTYKKKLESILKSGLNGKQRWHVHFSCSPPTGRNVISGVVHVDVLIYLDIKKALEGMELYISDNRGIVSDGVVPAKFFEKIESWPDRRPIVLKNNHLQGLAILLQEELLHLFPTQGTQETLSNVRATISLFCSTLQTGTFLSIA